MSPTRSGRLRHADIRRVFRLLGDIRDLQHQPTLQRQRAVDGLCEIVGAWQGISAMFEGFTASQTVRIPSVVSGGWPDAPSLRMYAQWAGHGRYRDDPLVDATVGKRGPVFAARRIDIVTDKTHQRSSVYEAWYEPAGVGDSMVCFYRQCNPEHAAGIAIHRAAAEPEFSERDRRLLRLFNVEFYRLYRAGLLGAARVEMPSLPPRQEQVLQCVLRGDSAKQIAQHLGLSRRTIDGHMKALYDRFGVADRLGLMAKFIALPAHASPTDHG